MFHHLTVLTQRARLPHRRIVNTITIAPLIKAAFLVGLLAGSLFGLFSMLPTELLLTITGGEAEKTTFVLSLWRCVRFPVLAAVFASSILGIVFLPLLSALRAFFFSCSIAILLTRVQPTVLLNVLISHGIPALFGLPAVLIAMSDGIMFSKFLLMSRNGALKRDLPPVRHAVYVALLSVAEALCRTKLTSLLLGAVLS